MDSEVCEGVVGMAAATGAILGLASGARYEYTRASNGGAVQVDDWIFLQSSIYPVLGIQFCQLAHFSPQDPEDVDALGVLMFPLFVTVSYLWLVMLGRCRYLDFD